MKITADDKIPFLRGVFEKYNIEVIYKKGSEITNNDLVDSDALIVRTRTKCNRELLKNTVVKAVASATIGTDHVNLNELEEMGIAFFNAPGCNAMSVQQYIVCALLFLADKYNIKLCEKTIGIIGVGHVGSAVEKACRTIGMKVLLNDPPRAAAEGAEKFTSLTELLKQSDFVTMHVPLDRTTEHLADANFFALMKPDAFFINSSRGNVCDNQALKNTLKNRKIRGAILDVWENEPDIDRELQKLLELGTMHIAGYSADGKANGTEQSVKNIAKALNIKELINFKIDSLALGSSSPMQIKADSPQEALSFAARQSYDIQRDSDDLKKNPENFEKLRGDYYCRREFSGRTFCSQGLSKEAVDLLKNMNFKTEDIHT